MWGIRNIRGGTRKMGGNLGTMTIIKLPLNCLSKRGLDTYLSNNSFF